MRERLCKRCEVADISMRAPNARYCYDCSYFKTVEPYSYGKLKEENERLIALNVKLLAALKDTHHQLLGEGYELSYVEAIIAKAEAKEHA